MTDSIAAQVAALPKEPTPELKQMWRQLFDKVPPGGMGIANTAAAMDEGARVFDGSLGGLGGCPFAPGATGNVVLEDLVYLCETKGFRTGIDLDRLIEVRAIPEAEMPAERLYGTLAKSGPPRTFDWRASVT